MDHETAVLQQAAERYVLHDLPPADREAFEEHYYLCTECLADVRAGQALAEGVRAVLLTERSPARSSEAFPKRRWWQFPAPLVTASLLANAVLVIAAGYAISRYRGEIDTLSRPALTAAIPVATVVRSEVDVQQFAVARGVPASLSFAVPKPFPEYAYTLARAGGANLVSKTVPSPGSSIDELLLTVPTTKLESGIYVVELYGVAGGVRTEIGRCRLQIAD